MRRAIIIAAAVAFCAPAFAADKPDLAGQFKAVCSSAFVKSEKLAAACRAGEAPKPLKDGSRFAAQGIGAELNALAANIHFALPACETEDAENCRWDAARQGNGLGQSFVNMGGRVSMVGPDGLLVDE